MQQQITPISPQTTIPLTSSAQLTPKQIDTSQEKIEVKQQNRILKIGQNQKQTIAGQKQKQEQQKQPNQNTLKDIEQDLNTNLTREQMCEIKQNSQDIFLCCVIQQKVDIFSIFHLSDNCDQNQGIKDCQQETQREQQLYQIQTKSNPDQNNEQEVKDQQKNKQDMQTQKQNKQKIESNSQQQHHQNCPSDNQNCPSDHENCPSDAQNSPSNITNSQSPSPPQSSPQLPKSQLSSISIPPPCPKLQTIPQYNKQSQFNLYSQYRKYIVQILQTKCTAQKSSDFIYISFTQYKQILNIWFNLPKTQFKDDVGVDGFVKFGDLRRLAYGGWVHDVVISGYVAIVNARIHDYVIYDSLKVTSIFSKKDPKQITRLLQKSTQITPNLTLIFVIHHNNHWYFLQLPPSSSSSTIITIYDSLPYKISSYNSIPLLKQIIDYFSIRYDRKLSYKICQNYPEQNNDCDCGVITICGIRDVVRKFIVWSFDVEDIGYKRVLITRELLAGCPVDF